MHDFVTTIYFHTPGIRSAHIDGHLVVDWQVEWGEASMLQAERLLLEEALKDPLNQRFILLSDR